MVTPNHSSIRRARNSGTGSARTVEKRGPQTERQAAQSRRPKKGSASASTARARGLNRLEPAILDSRTAKRLGSPSADGLFSLKNRRAAALVLCALLRSGEPKSVRAGIKAAQDKVFRLKASRASWWIATEAVPGKEGAWKNRMSSGRGWLRSRADEGNCTRR